MLYKSYVDRIAAIFDGNDDRHESHKLARPILAEMAASQAVLHEIIKKNLLEGNYWTTKKTTVIDLEIAENHEFSIRAHCFMPLPDRAAMISHQSIHHHGNLLLTTAAVFGEKYSSILFKKTIKEQPDHSFSIPIEKVYDFRKGDVEFIDAYQPHIVFIPENLFITYALWSTDRKYNLHKAKNNFLVRQFKKPLKFLINQAGLSKKLGVNNVEGFDFYPDNGKIYQLRERHEIAFPRPKENYIQNLFWVIRQTGFSDIQFLESLRDSVPQEDFAIMNVWIQKLKNGETFSDEFVPEHIGIKNVNIPFARIMECYKQGQPA